MKQRLGQRRPSSAAVDLGPPWSSTGGLNRGHQWEAGPQPAESGVEAHAVAEAEPAGSIGGGGGGRSKEE
ncbi:hypothetical protein E2562_020896 [Oryza meyeriana var. granulata]|uniref:Uncharacterized protein n=1 Tax=Oryza meyeriana var. granulata TaxID=110450 RepID=A0A6G1D515_9ORYZ|nr:hypothetical protein E2562_020896 [Oryza meyeriana var. granulata]